MLKIVTQMSFSFYLFLFISLILFGLGIAFTIQRRKKSRSELYNKGVHNENDGHYNLALHNYADALSEMRRLNIKNNLSRKIAERVKVLRSTIEYEKNFQSDKGT